MAAHLLLIWVFPEYTFAPSNQVKNPLTVVAIPHREIEHRDAEKTTTSQSGNQRNSPEFDQKRFVPTQIERGTSAPLAKSDTPLPHINIDVIVHSAGAIARETKTAKADPRALDLAISPMAQAIANSARDDVWVESKTSQGWVMKNGKTTCIVAPSYVPHYMQGMLIVPQCTVNK